MVCNEYFLSDISCFHAEFHVAFVVSALCALFQVIECVNAILRLMGTSLWLAEHPFNFGTK